MTICQTLHYPDLGRDLRLGIITHTLCLCSCECSYRKVYFKMVTGSAGQNDKCAAAVYHQLITSLLRAE
jgi:hypothetical protein